MSETVAIEMLRKLKSLRQSDLEDNKREFGEFLRNEGDFKEGEFDIDKIEDYMDKYTDDEYGIVAYSLGWLEAEKYIINELERLLKEVKVDETVQN